MQTSQHHGIYKIVLVKGPGKSLKDTGWITITDTT